MSGHANTQEKPLGLVAGSGAFPAAFVREARARGRRVVCVGHRGETDPALEAAVDAFTWVRVGQFGKVLEALKSGGVDEAVLLGGLTKTSIFDGALPDATGLKLLARVAVRSDDNLLRAIAREFEGQGIRIIPSAPYLRALAAPEGVLGREQPTADERADIAYGLRLAKHLGAFDVGQTVVVKQGVPVALEGIEGTDACIERGARLAGAGAVVVKCVKPAQDARFDLPAAGPVTLEVCAKQGIRVLAVEAGGTLLADRAAMVKLADAHHIVFLGVRADETGPAAA